MNKLIAKILVSTAAFFLASEILSGFNVIDLKAAFMAALLLAVLNVFLKPVLKIISLPITFMTLGLFLFVINGFLITLIGDFIQGVEVLGFIDAIKASVIISLCNMVANSIFSKE